MGPSTAATRAPCLREQAQLRWSFLLDWIKCLQKHLSYVERQELESATLQSGLKYLCVYVPWPPMKTPAYESKLLKLREAVELVGLMLELDKDSWCLLHHPKMVFLEEFDPDDYDHSDLTPHFLFTTFTSKKVGGDTFDCIAACADVLIGCTDDDLSDEFHCARQQILYAMDTRGRLEGFQAPLSIVFSPDQLDQECIPPYIKQAKTLVKTIDQRSRTPPRGRYPFKLTQVIFRPWKLNVCDLGTYEDSLESLVQCVRQLGIELVEVALFLEDPKEKALGKMLLTATRPVESQHGTCGRVDTLMLTKTTLWSFVSACSALLTSTSITRLQLYEAFDENLAEPNSTVSNLCREAKWQWLGFALFSQISQSTIHELYIDDDRLLKSDLEALKRISEASHPLQALCIPDMDAGGELSLLNRCVQLEPDAKLLLSPFDFQEHSFQTLSLPFNEYFPVINEETESEWMEILLPGYGRAMVACESIADVEVVKLDSKVKLPQLTSLHLAFNFCDQGAVALTVQTIGHALVSLNIDAKDAQLVRAADVTAILESCPSLKMLSMNRAKIGSLELFTRAYVERQCRIATLALINVEVSNTSLCEFATILTDAKHPMTRTLREFRFIYGKLEGPRETPRPDVKGVKLFLNMLDENCVLQFFELGLAQGLYPTYAPKFQALDAKVVISHASDLPIESKLAFLSCIQVEASTGTKRIRPSPDDAERPRLSRSMVAAIFAFARKRIRRVVSATK